MQGGSPPQIFGRVLGNAKKKNERVKKRFGQEERGIVSWWGGVGDKG